jgi:hypothetical protein
MSPIAAPFVIIMNDDLESCYMQWRVVHRDPTLADARLHNQYSAVIASYPRNHYQAVLVEAKTLIHAPSGIVKWATIYKLSELTARVRIKRSALAAGVNGKCVRPSSRSLKAHAFSLGKKNVARDERVAIRKGKPGGRRAFAPLMGEKTSRTPKRGKIGT